MRWKLPVLAGLAGVLLILSAGTDAQAQMKIGYIDAQMILANYKEFQDVERKYREFERELQAVDEVRVVRQAAPSHLGGRVTQAPLSVFYVLSVILHTEYP